MNTIMAIQVMGAAMLVGTAIYVLFTKGAHKASEPTLEQLVHEAIDNAVVNGFYGQHPRCYFVDDIAEDLTECCATFEGVNPHDLEPHVKSWLVNNR